MTSHEKSIIIIQEFGMKPKKIAEIIHLSSSVVYDKQKQYHSNRFTDIDYFKLKKHILESAKKINDFD